MRDGHLELRLRKGLARLNLFLIDEGIEGPSSRHDKRDDLDDVPPIFRTACVRMNMIKLFLRIVRHGDYLLRKRHQSSLVGPFSPFF